MNGLPPRRLPPPGGLPFFGGAGSNYSLHAVAEVVRRVRREPGVPGLVGANGGQLSKYAVGVYSARPRPWVQRTSPDGRSTRASKENSSAPSKVACTRCCTISRSSGWRRARKSW